MSRGYQPGITIREAIEHIESNHYLLPSIQRRFVWKAEQIELLFDSIMREYPINSLMLWEISGDSIKNNIKFYSFLRKYVEKHNEINEYFNAKGSNKDFFAVIDGQQRLNSLFIGLKGTYAAKLPHKHSTLSVDNYPTKKLYLNIAKSFDSDSDIEKMYEFSFLTPVKVERDNKLNNSEKYWFEGKRQFKNVY